MSDPVTFPGVFIEEVGKGMHPIPGVPTGIAAFVGRAALGPADRVTMVSSYAEFTRYYGGLNSDCPMSYAVRDYFDNGGTQAVVARLYAPKAGDGCARLAFPAGDGAPLILRGANPGAWGNRLSAAVDRTVIAAGDLVNLTLTLHDDGGEIVATERYLNLAAGGQAGNSPERLDRVLDATSALARVDGPLPASPPADGAAANAAGGDDGDWLGPAAFLGDPERKTGLHLLDDAPVFNLLCIPPDRRLVAGAPDADLDPAVRAAAAAYCARRRAFFVVDPPAAWEDKAAQGKLGEIDPADLGIAGEIARNAAVYFPRLWKEDPLANGAPALFAPCGAVAGAIAATDAARGVWKAPAGTQAGLAGVLRLAVALNDAQSGLLNPLGINCLRSFPTFGPVIWGARTLRGADALADDYKYIPVRRLSLFIEESIDRGTQWAAFEPNAEPLWSALRLQVGAFLNGLFRQGAFYDHAVQCDATTTTQDDIDTGRVNIQVLFAPLKPAEFVVIRIQQMAGQAAP